VAFANITGIVLDSATAVDPRAIQSIVVPQDELNQVNVTVTHANGSAFDLTGSSAILTVYRGGGNPPYISRAATISFPTSGQMFFPLVAADTSALYPQAYGFDVLLIDSTGVPHQLVPIGSNFVVTRSLGVQGQATTAVAANLLAYWGMAAIPGGSYLYTFITALTSSRLQSAVAGTYNFAAGDGVTLYAHLAVPAAWSSPVQFKDTNTGQNIAFTEPATAVQGYNIWRAPQANSAAFNYAVT
jgi:hypothetical protein